MPGIRTEFGMGNLGGDLSDGLLHLCRMALERRTYRRLLLPASVHLLGLQLCL